MVSSTACSLHHWTYAELDPAWLDGHLPRFRALTALIAPPDFTHSSISSVRNFHNRPNRWDGIRFSLIHL
jgi:hypothetical protein